MENDRIAVLDPRSAAALGIVWLIVLNKPFYPFYVWWITGHGLAPAFLAALSAPAFAALILLARRDPLWLLAGLPVLGALDTAYTTKVFGAASGAELYYVPCALLLAVLLPARAHRLAWALAAALFVLVVALNGRYGAALYRWSDTELAGLFTLNLVSVASLSLFILVRFARIGKAGA